MMRAIVKRKHLDHKFELVDVKIPMIDENEMLVKIKAIGVGVQDGYFFPQNVTFPFVIGIEAAGEVVKVGSEVINYKVNDRIAFISFNQLKGGTYAEYAVVSNKSLIISIPDEMDFVTATAIPMSADAALKALNDVNLKSNETLFIAGSSGAIGTFLIQIAKERGINVIASASLKNHQYMQDLGASKTVDYQDDDWIDQVIDYSNGGVDGAIATQPNTTKDSMQVVKTGGVIVTISGDMVKSEDNITVKHLSHRFNTKEDLKKLYKQVLLGDIKVEINNIYDLDDGIMALNNVSKRHARGKTIIKVE